MDIVTTPKQKSPYDRSPGYVGYLWKNKDRQNKAPHEVMPLDFTPVHLPYPEDWKNRFATKGFMIALHVPSTLAKNKNRLTRALYRIGKTRVDVKKEWKFLNELKNLNVSQVEQQQQHVVNNTETSVGIHPVSSGNRIKGRRGKNEEANRETNDPIS